MLRRMALEGRNAALLDADPVQKLIGPPACVTLGQGAGQRAAALAFIGTVNPLQGWRRLITGTGCLAAEVGDRTPLLVNTSGLLAGAGRRLKAAKIAAVRPDLLVAVGEGMELDAVLADHRTIPTTRLPRSPHARRKGEGERRALRRSAFRDYFATAPAWTLPLERRDPRWSPRAVARPARLSSISAHQPSAGPRSGGGPPPRPVTCSRRGPRTGSADGAAHRREGRAPRDVRP